MDYQEHLEKLKPFVSSNETAIEAHSTESQTFLLTDRQLLRLRGVDFDEEVTVESIFLDSLGGFWMNHEPSSDYDEEKLWSGGLSMLVAVFAVLMIAVVDNGPLALILLLVGGCVGLIGLGYLIDAFNTGPGTVQLKLQTRDGDTALNETLEDDHLEFVETVVKTVSEAHTTPGQPKRKIG